MSIRVIGGSARGRRLSVPGGAVRPTKDMVREAVFSALDARGRVADAEVLDLFAGSGALGIEALSRGAASATFVEHGPGAASVIRENVHTLGFDGVARVVRQSVVSFLASLAGASDGVRYDLVFADPPYTSADADTDLLLAAITAAPLLADDALVVVERPAGAVVPPPPGLRTAWERTFGDTLVVFLGT